MSDLPEDLSILKIWEGVESEALRDLENQKKSLEAVLLHYELSPLEKVRVRNQVTYLKAQIDERTSWAAKTFSGAAGPAPPPDSDSDSDSGAANPASPPDFRVAARDRKSLEDKLTFGATVKDTADTLREVLKIASPESTEARALKTDLITLQYQTEMIEAKLQVCTAQS